MSGFGHGKGGGGGGGRGPLLTAVPRAAAQAVIGAAQGEERARLEHEQTAYEGQQAGVPGMGPAPELRHLPGGEVITGLQHPAFTTVERMERKLPEEGFFDPTVSPNNPFSFSILSFKVPQQQTLWLLDYQFLLFRFSGVDPADIIVAETGRFSNQIGFDINLDGGKRKGNISYQLDPSPITFGRPGFEAPTGFGARPITSGAFDRATANTSSGASNVGSSLLPARPNVQGARGAPFAFIVGAGTNVNLNAVVFNSMTATVAAVEGRFGGYLIHQSVSSSLLQRVRPR